jgi:2-polyprenyl-3-methyl-5-hydroxy-6-metoxy-1,4-benzoquinol methylase
MRECQHLLTSGISRRNGACINEIKGRAARTSDGVTRDYNQEYKDAERKYAYDFDSVLRQYMMRTLGPWFRPGRALELGCYKGEVTEMLAAHFTDLTVVEAADELVAIANRRVPSARFVTATFETVALEGQFDSVFLIHTLEHLDDAVGVLRRIGGWLSASGRLFVVVPNAPSRQIAVQMGLISHNAAVTDAERLHGHRVTYTLDTLTRDARVAGLSILHSGGVFFKALANYQFDSLLGGDVVTDGYLEGCYRLGLRYPDLCASIYLVCGSHQGGT